MAQKPFKIGTVMLGWVIANSLGVAAIGALSLIPFLTSIRGMLVVSLLVGLPISIAQWIALRRVTPISILWVLTISAGLFLGLVVIDTPIAIGILGFTDDESLLSLTAAYMIIGLLVGLAQWFFLRGHFAKPLVWPLCNVIGLGLGMGLVIASNLINQSGLVSIILVLLIYSTVTGLAFSWMPALDTKAESNLVDAA